MLGDGCRRNWMRMLEVAAAKGVDVSLDLNHRVALGPLAQLWEAVEPNLGSISLIITSRATLRDLARLLRTKEPEHGREVRCSGCRAVPTLGQSPTNDVVSACTVLAECG